MTLDDDVAALLNRLLRSQRTSLKKLVNDALRAGLRTLSVPATPRSRFVIRPLSSGPAQITNFDCVGEVLELIEGETYK